MSSSTEQRTAHVHRLPDGRALAYAEFGHADGRPLIFCHGFPGSRLEGALLDGAASTLGVRVIAPDRPGHGLSDFKRRRRIAHWPSDVASLADALGLDRFVVLGVSAGGPYAAACAALLADRTSVVGIASGWAPPGAPVTRPKPSLPFASGLGRRLPPLRRLSAARASRRLAKNARAFVEKAAAKLPPADRAVFADAALARVFADDMREAFRQGARGPAWDARAIRRRWGFRLEEIRAPVWMWHGHQDRNVPPGIARYVAERIPGSRALFYAEDGHVSTFVNHVGEMLKALSG